MEEIKRDKPLRENRAKEIPEALTPLNNSNNYTLVLEPYQLDSSCLLSSLLLSNRRYTAGLAVVYRWVETRSGKNFIITRSYYLVLLPTFDY